ncbi:hypothetical protein COCON_G00220280 [Conger conger]|uniref:Peptidase C19 ubiquitin carboxyl-terminal hydrolase domain-containing protein n=1 Tax=Conger conger TaxID=82655 RepID=A0A9Q1CYR2_CONCO|nr:hypothetical protein COCON_G00220280 [Conger conger]
MAARSNQCIFGEFSADEFLQFFVTPRCYVELPPFNERASSLSQSSGSYCPPPVPYATDTVRLQVCGEDYQHIRFGVDDVMSVDGVVKDGLKVCSTLNPQAPEFILGGPGSQRPPHSPRCGSTEPPPADAGRLGPDLAGAPGSLGQRERKKKKKRPPGYYNYLEDQGPGGHYLEDQGPGGHYLEDEGVGGPGGPGGPGLVNGHALGVTELAPEDTAGDVGVAERGSPAPGASAAGVRTCESADESSLDFSSGPGSSSDSNNMASSSSSSSSHSGGGAEGEARTAEPPPPPAESPQSAGSGRQSPAPGPASPPAACSSSSAPAGGDGEERCVSNGPVEPDAVSLDDGQKDSSVIGGAEAPPMATEARSPPPPAVPTATVPKSWASLFHNSKPVPGGPPAYVEVINAPPTVTAAPAPAQTPEGTPQGPGGPVPVSEDSMAPKLAELIENVKLIHKPVSLQPRGLINKGNWCYINATLQALIACPPMYHLMKSFPALNSTQRPAPPRPCWMASFGL